VVRTFPRTTRRRAIAALAAASLLSSVAALPVTAAEDLRGRKDKVRGNISNTLEHLDQSSAGLVEAADALAASQDKLSAAQTHLAETRGELAVAVVFDQQMQTRLDGAVRRLRAARGELAASLKHVEGQEQTLGEIAAQNYQSGGSGLLGLSMVLTTQDPAQLTGQLNSVQNVMDMESATLDRLYASRILLTVKEETVEAARRRVAAHRQGAAENLERKQGLEADAEEAESSVSDLTDLAAAASNAAVDAREADLEQLRGLQQERDRISELLRRKADEARLAAAAAAAAASAAAVAVDLGSRPSNGFLDYPLNSYITSRYGMRLHPIYNRWTLHDGTDFGAACGTPIRAAAAGTVIATYDNAGYGRRVIMDNGFHRGVGLGTAYNHLSADSTFVGEKVGRGDIIDYVGNTGYSTGCHLHFMVYENGVAVDPMQWL